jgi:cytochrome oxidase Cu insertion factor (SCO1/SenC/PrrC family)
MSAHMKEIQDALPAGWPVKLVSFTTDPDYDTPPVMRQYAARYSARAGQWLFLTGTKAQLRRAAAQGLKLSVLDKPPGERDNAADLFIHSEKFVIIDRHGHIRAYYDGEADTGPSQALAAAKALARQ